MSQTETRWPKTRWEVGIAPEEVLPVYLIGAAGAFFCRVVGRPGLDGEAIARLFYSSPKLFDSLKAIVDEFDGCPENIPSEKFKAAQSALFQANPNGDAKPLEPKSDQLLEIEHLLDAVAHIPDPAAKLAELVAAAEGADEHVQPRNEQGYRAMNRLYTALAAFKETGK